MEAIRDAAKLAPAKAGVETLLNNAIDDLIALLDAKITKNDKTCIMKIIKDIANAKRLYQFG